MLSCGSQRAEAFPPQTSSCLVNDQMAAFVFKEREDFMNEKSCITINCGCCGNGGAAGGGTGEEHVYSMEEHVVGTWIDGKPIYERTYVANNISLSGSKLAEAIESLDQVINISGFADCHFVDSNKTGHWTWPINTSVISSNSYYLEVFYMTIEQSISESGIYCHLTLNGTETYKNIFVTIQYTKTLD